MVVGYRVGLACSAYPTVVGGPGVHRAYERWARRARTICRGGGILVHNVASLISAGTEKMVIDLAQKSLVGKAKERPDLIPGFKLER